MTKEEWESATEEERNAEIEKCKDPVYFYNNYFMVDGKKPNPMTREQWVDFVAYGIARTIKWRHNRVSMSYIEEIKNQVRKELNY